MNKFIFLFCFPLILISFLDKKKVKIKNKILGFLFWDLRKEEYSKIIFTSIFFTWIFFIFIMSVSILMEKLNLKSEIWEWLSLIVIWSTAWLYKMAYQKEFSYFNSERKIWFIWLLILLWSIFILLFIFPDPFKNLFNSVDNNIYMLFI